MKKKLRLPSDELMDNIVNTATTIDSLGQQITNLENQIVNLEWKNLLLMELITTIHKEKTND